MSQTPFPTVFEIIRFIAIGFDTKASNKQLDDLARDVFSDYRQVEPMLEQVLIAPLTKYVSPQFANTFSSGIQKMLTDYLELVSLKSVDGISRGQVLPVLVPHWFVANALKILTGTLTQLPNMPSAFLLLGNANPAVGNVLEWASDHVEGWAEIISALPKEKKDQLSNWQKGKHLPDLQSLHLLMAKDAGQSIPQEARERLMGLLVLARAVDSLRSLPLGETALDEARQQLMGAQPVGNLYKLFESYQQDARLRVESIWPHLGYLSNHLRRKISKSQEVQSESRKCLDDLTSRLKALGEYEASKHKVSQLEGRCHVFSGDLKAACKHYALAVEAALYRAGNELEGILEEAFCVAAKANNIVLMRNVKNSQIMFKVDIESVNQQLLTEPRKKIEQFVQDWEIRVWAKQFERIFPKSGLFPKTSDYESDVHVGSITMSKDNMPKPDYRNPNRKFKVGYKYKVTYPQVIWFLKNNENGIVKNLIERGANIDVESSSGDTPLIMALENLVVTDPLPRSLDDTALKLIVASKGVEKTVNKQTHKKRLLPIILAVESGRPEVVELLLNMGADVNLRGESDNQTALNKCISWIGMVKDPDGWEKRLEEHPITPELLDGFRRHSNGLMGASIEEQLNFLSPKLKEVQQFIIEEWKQWIIQNMSLDRMRDILKLLLDAGADVNAAMQSPIQGYTPLMLAVELDLEYEFSLMLQYNADLDQEFYHPQESSPINCWVLAKHHRAKKVLKVLDDIRPYYRKQ